MGSTISLSHVDVDKMHEEEVQRRRHLLDKAKAGDKGALIVLRERYGLRLPLIEATLRARGVHLPWAAETPAASTGADRPPSAPTGAAGLPTTGESPTATRNLRTARDKVKAA